MSILDALFDDAMKMADEAIMDNMSVPFILELRDGCSLTINGIYDTQLSVATGSGSSNAPRPFDAMFEHGLLTVLGVRLERRLVFGAAVDTAQGRRVIADINYPDATSTVLVLGLPDGDKLPAGNGVRFIR
ncbi:MAG: hypothetical protein ACRDBF_07185 [Plesiomonas shigelloides]